MYVPAPTRSSSPPVDPTRGSLRRSSSRRPCGITLLEMLISVALTLLVMLAVVQVFELMGSGLREGRATIEMAGQLRSVAHRLQQDLDQLTAPTLPWIDPGSGMGYLEVIEGPGSDRDTDNDAFAGLAIDRDGDGLADDIDANAQPDQDESFGDIDDVLMFTIRSQGEPFVGRVLGALLPRNNGMVVVDPSVAQEQVIESQVAEVTWWIRYDDLNGNGQRNHGEPFMLYRRLLLIRPDLDLTNVTLAFNDFVNEYDVSARPNSDGPGMIANSLTDLSKRENRFAHLRRDSGRPGRFFPYPLNPMWLITKYGEFLGEDVILSEVRSFDVRVFDPQAPLDVSGAALNAALVPGDPGYRVPAASPARGGYVDLNYARDATSPLVGSLFSGPAAPRSRLAQLADTSPVSVFDTWPTHYERDGIDQDDDGVIDEGTNGLDDDNVNGVDDVGERETAAPYGVPLRGIQVTIRMIDFSTRQVRQVSVVGDFVPE